MEETDKIAGNAETIWTKAYLTENHSLILFGCQPDQAVVLRANSLVSVPISMRSRSLSSGTALRFGSTMLYPPVKPMHS